MQGDVHQVAESHTCPHGVPGEAQAIKTICRECHNCLLEGVRVRERCDKRYSLLFSSVQEHRITNDWDEAYILKTT